MLTKTTKSKTIPIGLDLGDTALRAVQLRRSGNDFVISAWNQVERSTPAAAPVPPIENELKRLFTASSFVGKSVVAALNPPEVEFHVVDVPQAALQAGANAAEIIHWEIGRLTPSASGAALQVETRHWLLPARPAAPATTTAMGVSAARESVTRLVSAVHKGGFRCVCVDTAATALHRFGRLLRPWSPDDVWGLLDLGARHSTLILCLGDAPILIRHTGAGGLSMTERIAEALHLSPSAAEIQKRAHGIAVYARREGKAAPASQPAQDDVAVMLLSALRSSLNEMAAEIKRSYEYVLSSYPGRRAGDLVLVGGGANMPNLPEFLSGILGIPVRRCSSYFDDAQCRIRPDKGNRNSWEEFAVGLGLAVVED